MSIWGVLGVLFLVIQFIYEQYKKSEKSAGKSKKSVNMPEENREELETTILPLVKSSSKKRKIIDRENEIINSNFSLKKDKIVQDFIMAEILSKPKSKK